MHVLEVCLKLAAAGVVLMIFIKLLSRGFDTASEKLLKMDPSRKRLLALIGLGILVVLPFILSLQPYALRTAIVALLYVVLALSLNFVLGFAGQLSMGHSAFYGVGAYVTALLTVNFHISFWLALPLSALAAAVLGFVLGMPTLRLKGDYLAIVTIGFAEILRLVLVNWNEVTRGPAGIPGIPAPSIFGYSLNHNIAYYFLILALAMFTCFVAYRLWKSRLGRGLMAVRDDEIAAEAMGINATYLKVLAFVLGAALAGVAGSFFASFIHYVNPDNFNYAESVIILCMVVLGGIGSIPGVIVGAIILSILPEVLRDIATYRYAIYGMLLILMMIIRPQGMISVASLKGGGKHATAGGKAGFKILRRPDRRQ